MKQTFIYNLLVTRTIDRQHVLSVAILVDPKNTDDQIEVTFDRANFPDLHVLDRVVISVNPPTPPEIVGILKHWAGTSAYDASKRS